MLKEIFTEQKELLDFFFQNLDHAQADAVFQLCLETKGLIVLTGVGKSGIVAEKIAMTLVSTGSKALYLPASNLLHGDIGILSADDTVIILSKSGETDELLNIVPFIQKKGAKTVALVSNPRSRLAYTADLTLTLPVEKELCPFDLAPTISTEVQLLFGDVLAMGLMKAKQFSLADYGENHPSGTIGKKANLKVEDVMIQGRKMPLCSPHHTVAEALPELEDKRLGCIFVVDEEGNFEGIFTDGDLRRSIQSLGADLLHRKIGELMTRGAITTHKDALAWDALKLMQKDPKRWVMMLPVLHEKQVVGVIRMHEIIHMGIA